MAEPRPNRRIQMVAVGFAVAALATAVIAVVVVATRPGPEPPVPPPPATNVVIDWSIDATDVVKLDKSSGSPLWTIVPDGFRVDDPDLRKALQLDGDDVVTAISGHPIKRERDVHRAVFDVSLMAASTLYVEVMHDHRPMLYRWAIHGDLREARRAASTDYIPGSSGSGSGGGLGFTPYGPPPTPDPPPPPDPLAATVKSIDDTHVEVPSTTVDQILANPMSIARGVRIVPSVKDGHPNGFKLYAIRPGSVFAALHFQNGDTILSINHQDLTSADKALELYTQLRSTKQLEIDIERRGRRLTLTIDIK